MRLTREQILGAKDIKTESVAVPEWGGEVLVRTLMGWERDALEASYLTADTNGGRRENFQNLRARLAALSIVDDAGERVFSDSDVVALGKKSVAALDRIVTVARRLSRLSEADLKELEGNSGPGPSAGITSG